MSFMARMRSFTGRLETLLTLSTMDGGISIFCCEKYWQRSAKRVLSSANSFCSAGNEFSRCSYSLRSSSGPNSPPGPNLSSAPNVGCNRSSFSSFDISLQLLMEFSRAVLHPFQTAVPLLFLLEAPVRLVQLTAQELGLILGPAQLLLQRIHLHDQIYVGFEESDLGGGLVCGPCCGRSARRATGR